MIHGKTCHNGIEFLAELAKLELLLLHMTSFFRAHVIKNIAKMAIYGRWKLIYLSSTDMNKVQRKQFLCCD